LLIDIDDTIDDENARSKDGADLGLITLFAAPVKIRSESIEEGAVFEGRNLSDDTLHEESKKAGMHRAKCV
jgi:hypothetical protein